LNAIGRDLGREENRRATRVEAVGLTEGSKLIVAADDFFTMEVPARHGLQWFVALACVGAKPLRGMKN